MERLERFARLQPENSLANYYYALSLWKQRKGPDDSKTAMEVESLLNKSVRLDSKFGPAYLQLGICLSTAGIFPMQSPTIKKPLKPIQSWKRRTIAWHRPTGARETNRRRNKNLRSTTSYQNNQPKKSSDSGMRSSSLCTPCGTRRRFRKNRSRLIPASMREVSLCALCLLSLRPQRLNAFDFQ